MTSLSERLAEYVRACFTGLWVVSHEHQDALAEIARLCRREDWRLAAWDVDSGFHLAGDGSAGEPSGGDPLSAIRALGAFAAPPDGTAVLVLENFHRFLHSAELVQALCRQITQGKQSRTFVVILAPVIQIPAELEKLFVVVEHELPGRAQLAGLGGHAAGDRPEVVAPRQVVLDDHEELLQLHRDLHGRGEDDDEGAVLLAGGDLAAEGLHDLGRVQEAVEVDEDEHGGAVRRGGQST